MIFLVVTCLNWKKRDDIEGQSGRNGSGLIKATRVRGIGGDGYSGTDTFGRATFTADKLDCIPKQGYFEQRVVRQ